MDQQYILPKLPLLQSVFPLSFSMSSSMCGYVMYSSIFLFFSSSPSISDPLYVNPLMDNLQL